MKVKNTITGKVYPDIEAALKDNCISNFSLAIAINKNYLWKNEDVAGNFLRAWEKGVQWLAEDIEKQGNYNQFNLKPLEVAFVKGDTVMITDVSQIYNHYSDVFSNYEAYGLTLQDVAEWCSTAKTI